MIKVDIIRNSDQKMTHSGTFDNSDLADAWIVEIENKNPCPWGRVDGWYREDVWQHEWSDVVPIESRTNGEGIVEVHLPASFTVQITNLYVDPTYLQQAKRQAIKTVKSLVVEVLEADYDDVDRDFLQALTLDAHLNNKSLPNGWADYITFLKSLRQQKRQTIDAINAAPDIPTLRTITFNGVPVFSRVRR